MSTIDEQGLAAGVGDVVDDVTATGDAAGERDRLCDWRFTHDAVSNWVLGHRRAFTEAMDAADAAIARGRAGDDARDEAEADAELGGEG